MFNQVTIIGVGLIGGSLAKAIKKNRLAKRVVGFFRNRAKLQSAMRQHIIDAGFCDIPSSVRNSDLVIIATPIKQIIEYLRILKPLVDKKTIIIDVGSAKHLVTKTADALGLNFVGTHPLAGSEKKGFAFSSSGIFTNSLVVITPTSATKKQSITIIKAFWRSLKAKIVLVTPQQHDTVVSYTSHLPHVIAFALMNTIPGRYLGFGASGLKDTTRIALSDPALWSDVLLSNGTQLLQSLSEFESNVKKLKKFIRQNSPNQLIRLISAAKAKRESL